MKLNLIPVKNFFVVVMGHAKRITKIKTVVTVKMVKIVQQRTHC